MDSYLLERIEQVYPTGLLQEPDESEFGIGDQDAAVRGGIGGDIDTEIFSQRHRLVRHSI